MLNSTRRQKLVHLNALRAFDMNWRVLGERWTSSSADKDGIGRLIARAG